MTTETTAKTDEKMQEEELCVLCGKPTGYKRNMPIQMREFYIEGAGQLCQKCFMKVYGTQTTLLDH